jgi:hypothetical protein
MEEENNGYGDENEDEDEEDSLDDLASQGSSLIDRDANVISDPDLNDELKDEVNME